MDCLTYSPHEAKNNPTHSGGGENVISGGTYEHGGIQTNRMEGS